ncbi:MAG: preprotein translocase subunit SecE [Ruminobacter sp.]|nr:preprotein translocase subunit SecE [Ruminobacter sp.]
MASQSKNKTVMKEKEVEVKDVSNAKNVVLWILSAVILVFAIGGNYVLLKQYSEFFEQNALYSLFRGIGLIVLILVSLLVLVFTTQGKKVVTFSKESVNELRKVVWPTWPETRQTTVIVCVVACLVAVMLCIFDLIFGAILGALS